MSRGGVRAYTSLLLDGDCEFEVHRHEATESAPRPYVVVQLGDGSDYHVVHLRDMAVIDRFSAALSDARDWLAAQDAAQQDEQPNATDMAAPVAA